MDCFKKKITLVLLFGDLSYFVSDHVYSMHSFHAMCKGKNPIDFVTSLCSGGIESDLIEFPPVVSRVHRCSS